MRQRRPWLTFSCACIMAFIFLPLVVVVWMSFFKSSVLAFPPRAGYSLHWYANLYLQSELSQALLYSLGLALAAAAISTPIGMLASLAILRSRLPFPSAFTSGVLMPLAIPSLVSGLAMYLYLYNLQNISGLELVPRFLTLVAAHVLVTLPWTFRFIHAGLQGMSTDIERASLDLGRSPMATLTRITIPLLRPSLAGAAIFAFIFSFGDLEISLFLVGPGKTTLPVSMVNYAAFKIDPTIAAMAVVQTVIIGVLLIVADRIFNFGKVFMGGTKQ